MGLFNYVDVVETIDLGMEFPPILAWDYQTKDFGCNMKTIKISPQGLITKKEDSGDKYFPAEIGGHSRGHFVFYTGHFNKEEFFEEMKRDEVSAGEYAKFLFWADIFDNGWLEYCVAVKKDKIIKILSVTSKDKVVWENPEKRI